MRGEGETDEVSSRRAQTVEAPTRTRPRREVPGQEPAEETPSDQIESGGPSDGERGAPQRRRWLRWGLFLLLPLVLIVGLVWYVTGGQWMTTTDAYVEADTVGVSTDVSGIVASIEVHENQQVTAGQVLYRLDPQPFQYALTRAEAQIGITRDDLLATQSNYQQLQAQVGQAQTDLTYYTTEFHRQQSLAAQHLASQQALDTARRNLEAAQKTLASAQAQLAGAAAKLNNNPTGPVEQNPTYLQAVAQRDEAARELRDSVVRAPFNGIVTRVTATEPGKYLAAATPAFYLVNTDKVWVEAQPKETELTYVRQGQPVIITVDTYPGQQWHGTVESIAPAASQQFSLLPSQDTSGNWVKVVQRIPMRVAVDVSDKSMPPLRAGMSAEVSVNTGHARGWPRIF